MYGITFLPPAEKYFKRLKEKGLKEKFRAAIEKIRENPYIGEAKLGDLSGIYGLNVYYNKTNYEIPYRIVELEDGSVVVVIMAGTRENFWDALKGYLR